MTLPVREFRAQGYRSLRSIAYPMSDLDVFVGPNGVGKTNLYRALELLRAAIVSTGAGKLRVVGKQDGATVIEGLKAWGEFGDDD